MQNQNLNLKKQSSQNRQPDSKLCKKCKTYKPSSAFSLARGNKDGLYPYCKKCVSISNTGIKKIEDLPGEEWRLIDGFTTYFISYKGRIKHSLDELRENIRIPHGNGHRGYLRLVLSEKNFRKTVSIHREVAKAFIPNPNNYETVNHKDFNVKNNNVENLEWLDIKDNITHSCKNGRHFKKAILQLDLNGALIKEWSSAYEVETQLGYFSTLISRCCRNLMKSYKGYIWQFKKK